MDIGKLAVMLTGNAQPLLGTLSLAQSALQGWAASTVQAVNGLVAPAFTNTAQAIQKAMTDTFASVRTNAGRFLSALWDAGVVKRLVAQMELGKLLLAPLHPIATAIGGLASGIGKSIWAGLSGGGGKLSGWAKDYFGPIIEQAGKTAVAIGGWFGSVAKLAGAGVGLIMGPLSTLTMGLAGVGVAVVKDFIGAFAGGVEDLVRTDISARQLGLDVLELRAAMHFAGPAAGEMGQALGHLQEKFVALALGNRQAGRDLDSLAALSGTTAGALRAGGWSAVADAIASIPDPMARAAQATRLFGDAAGPLLQQFTKGAAGNAKGLMNRFGLGAGAGDLAAVRQVSQAMRDLQALGAGAFNQALLGVSAVVSELTKSFGDWKLDLTFIKPLVIDIAEGIGKFGVFLYEASQNSGLLRDSMAYVWKQGERGFLNFKALVLTGLADIADATVPLSVRLGTMLGTKIVAGTALDPFSFFTSGLRGAAKAASDQAGKIGGSGGGLWDSIMGTLEKSEWWKALVSGFVRIRAESNKTGDAIQDAMGAKVAAALSKSYEGMAAGLQRPADVFAQSMGQLGMMGQLGVGDARTRNLLANKAGMDLLGAAGMAGGPTFAASAEAQSREAYSSLAKFDAEGKRGGIQEQVLDALRALKMLEERQAENGARIAQAAEETARNTRADANAGMGGRL